jgi:hypothetical protein
MKPYSKKAKRARAMAQVTEHLPSKHEALGSKPSTTKKKKSPNLAIKMNLDTEKILIHSGMLCGL